ncbi:MAG: hypothetical protein J6K61_01745 [Clostridia bacterium]|nr:hypothetical protein [Clostridia bacterium]
MLIALPILLIWLFNTLIFPYVKALTETEITNTVTAFCSEIIGKALAEGEYTYQDLIHIEKDTGGSIASVSADMLKLNSLRYAIAKNLLTAFRERGRFSVSLPYSNLLGILLLSGKGKNLRVDVQTASSLYAGFETSFEEVGINQTIHSVYFTMEIEIYYLLPIKPQKMTFSHSFCAAQTILVGKVPDSLTQINRLGEWGELIDNTSIDDAVDFGYIVQ